MESIRGRNCFLTLEWFLRAKVQYTRALPMVTCFRQFQYCNATIPNNLLAISNGNRTEWSPIRSVIIRVINKIGRPRSGSPICLITSMITDRIGRHEVLLPINHNFNKICSIISLFFKSKHKNSKFCFASSEKKAI